MKRFIFTLFAAAALLSAAGCQFSSSADKKQKTETKTSGRKQVIFARNNNKTFPVSGFRTLDNKWCTKQTEVFLCRSKDGLTFTFHCFGDTEKMRFSKKAKDDNMNLFGGEHIELLLSPNGNADGIYYHIAFNPAGSIYHAKKRDTSWTPAYDLKIEKKQDRWIATLFLPYYTFGLKEPPANGKVWLANFCRTFAQKNKITEHSSFTGAKNFHSFQTMAEIVFDGKAPAAALRIFQFEQAANGDLKLKVGKNGTAPADLKICSNGKLLKTIGLKDNSVQEHRVTINNKYIPLKNNRLTALKLTGKNGDLLDCTEGSFLHVDSHFLLLNRYIYFGKKTIRFTVNSQPGTFRIKSEDKVIFETPVKKLKNSVKKNLAPGRYVAEYESNGRYTSCVFFVQDKRPKAQAALPNKFQISGPDLKLNGKPFYLFTTSEGKLQNYQYYPDFTYRYGPGARKNAIRRNGVPYRSFVRKPKTGYVFAKGYDAKLDKFIQSQKKHQWSNITYLLAYEASMAAFLRQDDNSLLEVDPVAMYKKTYTRMKQGMPDAKIAIHIDNLNRLEEFIDCCDIFEFACWNSSYHGSNLMQNLKKDFLYVSKRAKGKPLVMWLGGSIPNAQCRTAEELRAGVYTCILNGAAGNVIHMGHGGIPASRTRFWSQLNAIPREINTFFADLKTWKAVKNITIPANMDGKAVISPDGNELLLVLLNTTMEEIKVSIDLPASFGKLNKTFTPLEPRVFRIRKTK